MRVSVVFTVAALVVLASGGESAKILGLFQFPGRSHFIMFESLFKALAERGHEVTVLSHWPQKTPLANYTDISLAGTMNTFLNFMTMELVQSFNLFNMLGFIWGMNKDICEVVLELPVVQKMIHSDEKYDLIVTEVFGSDCFLGMAHKWQVPFIGLVSSTAFPWANSRVGNPEHPAYTPNYFAPYNTKMTFTERLSNTVLGQVITWAEYFFCDPPMQQLSMRHFGSDLPPLKEIAKNTSLILVNSHFSINQVRPFVPAMVEVGGLHIPNLKPLPKDLEKYLSDASQGVIYFSMGSLVRTETFDADKLQGMIDAFSRLKLRVLWKIDPETVPSLPDNVRAESWLPQNDLLNHPNVKLFITHGGLMGTQEAVHAGVPLLGIPLFADQHLNIRNYVAEGMAVKLAYDDISMETVLDGVNKVLNDDSYAKNAKRLSVFFRDRQNTARETAVYWTEYVIRHGGAHHLRSQAVNMPTYQYLLLDVIGTILMIGIVVIAITWLAIKKLFALICPAKKIPTKKTKIS